VYTVCVLRGALHFLIYYYLYKKKKKKKRKRQLLSSSSTESLGEALCTYYSACSNQQELVVENFITG
jgi:hypothetical protein